MIEVGKKYVIAIVEDSRLDKDLELTDDTVDIRRMIGEIKYIHLYGFIFKLDGFPKIAPLNVLWDTLRWIYPEEKS